MKLYPLVRVTLLFIAGLVLGRYLPSGGKLVPVFCAITLIVILAGYLARRRAPRPRLRRLFLFGLGLVIVSAGMLRYSLAGRLPAEDISRYASEEPVAVEGIIRGETDFQRHGARFILSCRRLDRAGESVRVSGLLQVIFHGQVKEVEPILCCGRPVRITARIDRPREGGNPGETSPRALLSARGIRAQSRIYRSDAILPLGTGGRRSLLCLALDLKHRLQRIIRISLPDPRHHPGSIQSALLEAVMLGERGAVPFEIRENFQSIGVIHVLVVSGLHVGFIWLLGNFLFSPLPLRWRHALIIPLVAGYVLLTGAGTATVRAGVMAIVYSLAVVLNQPRNTLTALAAAALALLLYNPLNLFSAGFQLSFLIVLTMVALVPVFDRRLRALPEIIRLGLAVPLAAQIGAFPLVAYYFHFVSLPALPANILIVPLVGAIVSLGFIASLSGLAAWPLAWLLNYPNRYLIPGLLKLVGWFSRLPGGSLRIGTFPVLWVFAWYIVLFGLLSLWKDRKRRSLIIAGMVTALLAAAAASLIPPSLPPLRAVFFNGKSGDITLIREANGPVIIISSDDDRFDDIPRIVAPYLREQKIGRVDYLVLTRAGIDHLNVLKKLLTAVAVGTVLDHPLGPSSPSYSIFRRELAGQGIGYHRLAADDLIDAGKCRLSLLWPRCRSGTRFDEDYSLVLRVRFGEVSFLFPSGIGMAAQEDLVESTVDLRSTVMKAPRRGSSAHVSPAFLRAVDPDYALLIQGQKYFGRYPRDCGDFLREEGAEVHRSGEEGCLVVETDGTDCKILSAFDDTKE
ncbi:MAG: ComEC/Rec2 family competence protein [PVC group bacterium]